MLYAHFASPLAHLPQHYATANGTDIEVVNLLLDAYPDSRLTTDKRGRTPLHFALGNVDNPPTPQLVKLLAGKTGESAKWPDENKMLPIHYACAYGASVEVMEELIQAWEESIGKPDAKGRLPIHFALGNADRPNSAGVAQLLVSLSPGCIDMHDSEKNLPLHLLSAKAAGVDVSKFMERENIKKCLNVYLVGAGVDFELLSNSLQFTNFRMPKPATSRRPSRNSPSTSSRGSRTCRST